MHRRHIHAVAHCFGLDTAPLLTTRSLSGPQISAARIVCGPEQFGVMEPTPPEDTFVAAISLIAVPYYELWSRGRPLMKGGFVQNSMRIGNLASQNQGRVSHPIDSVIFEIPRVSLESLAEEGDVRRVANLSCPHGTIDPTMVSVAGQLLSAFARPQEANRIFVDHIMVAGVAHLIERYGDKVSAAATLGRGSLTPAQLRRAQEMLAGNLQGDVLVADLAKACGVSRQYFIKAFKQMVGFPPHQWLQWRRVDRAKDMLRNAGVPISEIALACGFADQSHLTRVFTALTGATPALWRRQHAKSQG